MSSFSNPVEQILRDLEAIQGKVGDVQVSLLEILTANDDDAWDDAAQACLIALEKVQRSVGAVQVAMLTNAPAGWSRNRRKKEEPMPAADGQSVKADATSATTAAPTAAAAELATTHAPTVEAVPAKADAQGAIAESPAQFVDLPAWLSARGVQVKGSHERSGLDEAADRAALLLGSQFPKLRPFYEVIKRRVNGGREKWFPLQEVPPHERGVFCQFGTRLHDCGFLSEFRYVRRDECLLFIPLEDGRVQNFFTGGWLERYVWQVVRDEVRSVTPEWGEQQALLGARATLPDGGEAEFDLLAAIDDQRVLWLECKTGAWQNYITRFKTLNRRLLRLSASHAGAVLLAPLSDADRAAASELTGMTVLDLPQLPAFVRAAVNAAPRG